MKSVDSVLDALLEDASERGAHPESHEHPEDDHNHCQRQTAGIHEGVKEEDVDDDRSKESEGQRHVAVDKYQNRGDELKQEDNVHVVRNHKRANELAAIPEGGGAGMKCRKPLRPNTKKTSPSR